MSVGAPPEDGDWARWSRENSAWLRARNDALHARYGIDDGAAYVWDMETATFRFQGRREVVLHLQCIGTVSSSEGTFLWSWANEGLPPVATAQMGAVRAFGQTHDLGLMIEPEWPGAHPDGLEMLCAAARILDADGLWIDFDKDGATYFALFDDRARLDE